MREIKNIFLNFAAFPNISFHNILPKTMKASDPMMQPLSLDEFTLLEQFLSSDQTPQDALASIEMLDGYMTAAIVGPQLFNAEDWYATIWDQDKKLEPAFSSPEEAELINSLIVRHNNALTNLFDDDPESFLPFFDRVGYENEEMKKSGVEEWAMGFLIGMELVHDAWQPLFDDEDAAVLSMSLFMLSKVSEEFSHLTDREIAELTESVADCVISIYAFWNGEEEVNEDYDDDEE